MDRPSAASRTLALIDLTRLGDDDSPDDARSLCARSITPHGPVAAVCLWPAFVPIAAGALAATPVRVATVANFPDGGTDADDATRQCQAAIAKGADEVDIVFPYTAWQAGDHASALRVVAACRDAVGAGHALKVILETGMWTDVGSLRAAADACIEAGADFLKTSTGKVATGATTEAVDLLLGAVAARPERHVGVKASGGIRTVADAAGYLALADTRRGPTWAKPATFRFGASGLLDDVLHVLDAESPA